MYVPLHNKDKHYSKMELYTSQTINANGRLLDLSHPRIMGILNITPDSFYAESRTETESAILARCRQIIEEGGDIIDVGAYSSRPHALHISMEEEMKRLRKGLKIISREYPDAIISIDTFRAEVARMCVEEFGAAIINDIAAGSMDPGMFSTIARLGVPYIIMHMQGTPQNMQDHPHYGNVVKEVIYFFSEKVQLLRDIGVKDIIIDPGFGFGKTLADNYKLLNELDEFAILKLPLLVGVSRKSMIYKLLDETPQQALNGTTAIHAIALMKGANLLRVHDVRAAYETVRIFTTMSNQETQY